MKPKGVVSAVDEDLIVSYLLGDLDGAERSRLEERLLTDAEYREVIRAVEDDLVDDYVRGELPVRQRELFEKQFTASPDRMRKVELARALTQALGDSGHVPASEPTPLIVRSRWRPLISTFRYPLAAAAVLLLGLGVWFATQSTRTPSTVQSPQAAQRPPANTAPTKPEDRSAQPAPELSIATFVLPPGLVRDGTAATTFAIPAGTDVVRLRIVLDKGDEYPAYRAELRTASGNSVWKSDAGSIQTDAAGQSIALEVPAELLPAERYELTLTGVNRDVAEDIGYYYFSIAKR
jgi:hypothetical protein